MKKRGMSKCFLILLSYSLLITVISVCLNIILPVFQIPTAKILPYALCFLYWDINSIGPGGATRGVVAAQRRRA